MEIFDRHIIETLSSSRPELHSRLLQALAHGLGFVDFHGDLDTTSIPTSYIDSIESLKVFLSENFRNRIDWITRWWCPNVLTEFVGVLFESTSACYRLPILIME